MQQRTDEWFSAKIGKVGASRLDAVCAKGQGVTRKNYMMELLIARLTGVYPESYTSPEMERGTILEPEARCAYERLTGNVVNEVGFIPHTLIKDAGASPDGLIGIDGGLEIKCPNTATHLKYLMSHKIDTKYIYQMQWGMDCAEREWWDFVSYDNRLPDKLQIFIERFPRDEDIIKFLREEVEKFNEELNELQLKLEAL